MGGLGEVVWRRWGLGSVRQRREQPPGESICDLQQLPTGAAVSRSFPSATHSDSPCLSPQSPATIPPSSSSPSTLLSLPAFIGLTARMPGTCHQLRHSRGRLILALCFSTSSLLSSSIAFAGCGQEGSARGTSSRTFPILRRCDEDLDHHRALTTLKLPSYSSPLSGPQFSFPALDGFH